MSADLIHPGYINIIKTSSKLGKVTIGLLTEKAIASHKRLSFMTGERRYEVISNLKGVDKVIPQETLDYVFNIQKLKPDYVVHGDDCREGVQAQTRKLMLKELKKWGSELIEVPYTKNISSTQLNNAIKEVGSTPEIRRASLSRLLSAKPLLSFFDIHNA
tara:strand:- start:676 stop:1155 length:480 start_codon:yes stop_codon:yes gene_type:complete